jgi:hypothetical protein
MPTLSVDGLDFEFEDTWTVGKFDDWTFYRKQFSRMWNGIKSIDLLAYDPHARTLWLIEVKDYRSHPRTKVISLADEVAHKVFDTFAALLPAAANATVAEEKKLARESLASKRIRVVLHLEQPAKTSTLRPRAIDPANVRQELKRLLKPIDPHVLVAESRQLGSLAWTVG